MTDLQILIIVVASISSIVVGIPLLFGTILPILKPNINKDTNRHLYAFSSGFFLIMATVLFIGESKTHINEFIMSLLQKKEISNLLSAIIVTGVVMVGLFLSLGMKYIFARSKKIKWQWNNTSWSW